MNSARSPTPNISLFNIPGNKKNNILVNAANAVKNSTLNSTNAVRNIAMNSFNSAKNATAETFNVSSSIGGNIVQIILSLLVVLVILIFSIYWKEINKSFNDLYEYIRQSLGAKKEPIDSKDPDEDNKTINKKPINPKEEMKDNSIIEKVLPGQQEVFNISKNSYTYYDAEPLCKALNAELATYEQVKDAYAKGAEWCNYGWVKGQMAVYPTQKGTYDMLQSGPENQRMSCGNPGLNGGYFDNPELRFGVNCYGTKPDQKAHDATAVTTGSGAPLSPAGLEQQKKIAKYRGETNYISVLPWNKTSWSS